METQRRPIASPEHRSSGPEVRREKIRQHAFFFSGIRGRYHGLRSVQGALEDVLGSGNATVYDSAFLADKPRLSRYEDMAQDIKQKLTEGPVTLIAHSYGAVEAVRALFADPEILNDPQHIAKLNLIFVSPTFSKNVFEQAKSFASFGKIMVQEARGLGVVFPGPSKILGGVVSASSVPSDAITHEALMEAARIAARKLSHRSEHEVDFPQDHFTQRDYFSLLDPQTQDLVRERDRQIDAARETGKKSEIRKAFSRRGKDTKGIVYPIFEGEYSDRFKDPPTKNVISGTKAEARALRKKLVIDSARGKELKKLHTLQGLGVNIWIGVPEYDLLNSYKKAVKLLRGDKDHVFTVPFTTHGSPWSVQPDILSAMMQHCGGILSDNGSPR